ncbi:MAG TPA: DUF192 domain-containing protein [Candidatus Omnitrophota bacterium]|nr:DUF192 domain-containing protein [Candidatus Omnitrophota bacterium]
MMLRAIISVLAVLAAFPACGFAQARTASVCIKDRCVTAEIADTQEARATGLMHRDSLAPGWGMLFIFPDEAKHAFWMMNVRFPIDIIWIDRDLKIVHIEHSAAACSGACPSYEPQAAAAYVLEVPAGFCTRNSIVVGDTVAFTHPVQ